MDGSLWIATYVLLWALVCVLGFAVVVLLRQLGVLHARLQPSGVHQAGEGPERGSAAPPFPDADYGAAELTLLAFTSRSCELCAELRPGLEALDREYAEVQVRMIDHDDRSASIFSMFKVRSTPYLITVTREGIVQLTGVANSLEQAEVMLDESVRFARA